jgi:hypothetical protein
MRVRLRETIYIDEPFGALHRFEAGTFVTGKVRFLPKAVSVAFGPAWGPTERFWPEFVACDVPRERIKWTYKPSTKQGQFQSA